MKKIIISILLILTLFSSVVNAENKENEVYRKRNWAESGIKVAVNSNQISFPDQEPLLDADIDRTYVPVRFLAEALGAEVDWDDTHKVVIIKNYGIFIYLFLNMCSLI